jgi:hypothetical protein
MATVTYWFLRLEDNPKYKWWNFQPKKIMQWTDKIENLNFGV